MKGCRVSNDENETISEISSSDAHNGAKFRFEKLKVGEFRYSHQPELKRWRISRVRKCFMQKLNRGLTGPYHIVFPAVSRQFQVFITV